MIVPTKLVAPWKEETAGLRMTKCLALLELHGFVMDIEGDRIRKRMVEWLNKPVKMEKVNVT
jgi:hypothetical protein